MRILTGRFDYWHPADYKLFIKINWDCQANGANDSCPDAHLQDVVVLCLKRQVVQEAGKEAPKHRPLPYRRKPDGGQCLLRNCCQDHPKVTQKRVRPWMGFYWPGMGSSLTSGGRFPSEYSLLCVPYLFD